MKQLYTFIILILFSIISQAQVVDATLMHDGLERNYRVYVPSSYNGEEAVPLVFNFHGFGSNANEQMFYGDFRSLADEHGFLVCHPQGTEILGQSHFNVGGFTAGSTTDDVGFTNAMIDQIAIDYNINLERVYSTGMSNGGYMSFLLACQLSDRIAAVASVTGSMTPETTMECAASRDVPVMQIHGTEDATVPYEGDPLWTDAIVDVMEFWNTHNGCDQEGSVEALDDVNPNDGSTVEHITFGNCNNPDIVNEHYKVTGGGHTWPGTVLAFGSTNKDFSASEEVWRFFAQYDINGKIETISSTSSVAKQSLLVSPNPALDVITIQGVDITQDYTLISAFGRVVSTGKISIDSNQIDLTELTSGIYFVSIGTEVIKFVKL